MKKDNRKIIFYCLSLLGAYFLSELEWRSGNIKFHGLPIPYYASKLENEIWVTFPPSFIIGIMILLMNSLIIFIILIVCVKIFRRVN
jgi:hypothetical protein